ncbi:hypothetical protein MC7420_2978 [Coleofasciculus chthonoplastes PCC 7420]|uniref:Uncharacterized protein n=1 Tax=Coleofasciculus chthonoplastes PCC 7420 TaxID=118168 RepID=B4VKA7_9CYAN|nr:hypothetical protein MC7420_2978 [Coleofasciculus chthonoplastes PCC 7420]
MLAKLIKSIVCYRNILSTNYGLLHKAETINYQGFEWH